MTPGRSGSQARHRTQRRSIGQGVYSRSPHPRALVEQPPPSGRDTGGEDVAEDPVPVPEPDTIGPQQPTVAKPLQLFDEIHGIGADERREYSGSNGCSSVAAARRIR